MSGSATGDDTNEKLHVYLIAGEPSGDVIGARLIEALRAGGGVRLSGVGGPEMARAGLESLFPYGELAIMGLTEVLPSVPRILGRMRSVARHIGEVRPDVIVTIDSPGFVFGVIRRLASRDCPRVHYVAPTIWAWRAGRVKKFRRHFDHLLALFPFEPPLFEAAGLACTFVGHPAAEGDVASGDGAGFRARHGIWADDTLLCLLPGSRRGEVSKLAPVAEEVVTTLLAEHPDLRIVIPAAPNVRADIDRFAARLGDAVLVVDGTTERYDAFAASDLALAASGTVTLELAYAGVPTVVMYRVGRLTGEIARRMIRVRYASIVNIVAEREVFPEFLQSRCEPGPISSAVLALLSQPEKAAEIGRAASGIARDVSGQDGKPSMRAAETIRSIVATWRSR
ncbi:MAG: lipid-A-disaccharide synthase [Alphaproteobacteria bacterium]|nr:lipid-A-disaccharide synthase [Alphaproteobacteria bacterium]